MEILLGMILLLQVLASIQRMLAHKEVLQQINKQSEKVDVILENIHEWIEIKEERAVESNCCRTESETSEQYVGENVNTVKKKDAQEALINEVLSEVFS